MGSRVVFSLTEGQARALLELRAGRQPWFPRDRHGTRAESVLFDRGLLAANGRGLELTELGRVAAELAARLADT